MLNELNFYIILHSQSYYKIEQKNDNKGIISGYEMKKKF